MYHGIYDLNIGSSNADNAASLWSPSPRDMKTKKLIL
jgi:hypothetical protein